jgi:holin-like protein
MIIFGCLAIGEFIASTTGIKLPASIMGMLLLTLLLKLGWVKVAWVKGISDFLVKNLPLFFVPPGVAVMLYLDVIEANFWAIIVASIVSTIIVLSLTGWTHQTLRKSSYFSGKRTDR